MAIAMDSASISSTEPKFDGALMADDIVAVAAPEAVGDWFVLEDDPDPNAPPEPLR